MVTLLLVRHGRTTANASGLLAGRSPGVRLDATGRSQAAAAAARLAGVELAAVVSSPRARCRETARALSQPVQVDPGLDECDYGEWTGRPIKELAELELWRVVQEQPSAAVFPGGESLRGMQDRALEAVRRRNREFDAGAVWVAVSHGDVIKAILADALGTHFDSFQRIHVDPASVSIVAYGAARPVVLGLNTHAGDLGWVGRTAISKVGGEVGGGGGPA